MYPAKSNYLFFMLKPDGTHNFASNYEQHLKNIKTFRLYQKEKKKQQAIEKIAQEKKDKKAKEKETQKKEGQKKAKVIKDKNTSKLQ
jgi:hypothetical protein